ncbi:hypothetical protein DPMN_110721 [Dreissena polymorpha]|uniref:Uncharacterized protein n=1 Tax=Dreissena polymorpha TaxID=45954 RepID=A0A9D4KCI9_DREPO|nr:hypothetical protein DPMN_110721 [Dreissena polymorpha]
MPHAAESLLKVEEDVEDLTLVLQVFLKKTLQLKIYCALSSSESSLHFGQQCFSTIFRTI